MIFGPSPHTRDEALSYPGACPERHHSRQLFAQGLIDTRSSVRMCFTDGNVYVRVIPWRSVLERHTPWSNATYMAQNRHPSEIPESWRRAGTSGNEDSMHDGKRVAYAGAQATLPNA